MSIREYRKRLVELERSLAEVKSDWERTQTIEKTVGAGQLVGSMREIFSRQSKIFKDPSWLQPSAEPPDGTPVARERLLRYLASVLSEVFRSRSCRNIFIFGEPGTGKTLCVRYALDQLKSYAAEMRLDLGVVYVNAGRTRSPYYTMLEIVRALGVDVPDVGWQFSRLKQAFEKIVTMKPVIIAVDEMEALIFKQREPLIYYLNRQRNTTLILISNKFSDVSALPPRAKSTLQPMVAKFNPYTPEEAEEILAERVEKAFQPNTIPRKILRKVAEAASKAGDIRVGFSILLTAGYLAERDGRGKIRLDDLETAAKAAEIIL